MNTRALVESDYEFFDYDEDEGEAGVITPGVRHMLKSAFPAARVVVELPGEDSGGGADAWIPVDTDVVDRVLPTFAGRNIDRVHFYMWPNQIWSQPRFPIQKYKGGFMYDIWMCAAAHNDHEGWQVGAFGQNDLKRPKVRDGSLDAILLGVANFVKKLGG